MNIDMMPKNGKSSEELLKEISEKLDKLMGILAIQGKDEDTQIRILKSQGFTSEEVGKLIGLKETTIRMRKAWKEN